jgi:uncharacterized protein YjbJ (UPF0337 family)
MRIGISLCIAEYHHPHPRHMEQEPKGEEVLGRNASHRNALSWRTPEGDGTMDKDRVEGSWEQVKGKTKEVAGKVTGDSKTEAEGKAQKTAGKVQNTVGGLKDTLRGDN